MYLIYYYTHFFQKINTQMRFFLKNYIFLFNLKKNIQTKEPMRKINNYTTKSYYFKPLFRVCNDSVFVVNREVIDNIVYSI